MDLVHQLSKLACTTLILSVVTFLFSLDSSDIEVDSFLEADEFHFERKTGAAF